MHDAVNAYIRNDNAIDVIELSMCGIREAIEKYRDQVNNNSRQRTRSRPVNHSKNPIKNPKRREKSRRYGHYQRLYYRNKQKLVSELGVLAIGVIEDSLRTIALFNKANRLRI